MLCWCVFYRQWNVVDDPLLRYKCLNDFDRAMHELEEKNSWLAAKDTYISLKVTFNLSCLKCI